MKHITQLILFCSVLFVYSPIFAEKSSVHFHPGSCTTGDTFHFTPPRMPNKTGTNCPILMRHGLQETMQWVDLPNGNKKCGKHGKDYGICTATGSRAVTANIANSNVQWWVGDGGSSVNGSGDLVLKPSNDGTLVNMDHASCNVAACGCSMKYTSAFSSAQTSVTSFPNSLTSNLSTTISKAHVGTNYVYAIMSSVAACNPPLTAFDSVNVVEVSWSSSGGSPTFTQMSWYGF